MKISFENVSVKNYHLYYSKTQDLAIGPMLAPKKYKEDLWGILVFDDKELIAGWVGKKRIKNKYLRALFQEVYFDAMPQIFDSDKINAQVLIDKLIEKAKEEKIAYLSVSHWSRSADEFHSKYYQSKKNASYLVDVTKENLLSTLSHAQRKKVRKAERNNLKFVVFNDEEALERLEDFQEIRTATQSRAIARNKKASMLLKSIEAYREILTDYEAKLIATYTEDDELAAMLLYIKSGKTIYPYYSGSNIEINRATGSSTYLQWHLFLSAKEQGCVYVDMGGVPVNPDKSHPAYGVYVFKRDFGGEYFEYNSGDFVISKFKYSLVKLIKNNRSLMRFFSKKM